MTNKKFWFKNWYSPNIRHLIRCKKLFSKRSKFQKIEILESKIYGRILTLDNQIQVSTKFNSYVHESIIQIPMICYPKAKNILIIGGGDGFSLGELEKYKSIKSIHLVEIDEEVANTCKKYFPEVKKYFNNPRVSLFFKDGFKFIEETDKKYDVIILDISDPSGNALKIFSVEFLKKIKKIMSKKSVILTHCESPDSAGEIYYRIIQTYQKVFKIVRPFRVWTPHYADFWGRLIASDTIDPLLLKPSQVSRRIKNAEITLSWLTPELFCAVFRSLSKDIIKILENKRFKLISEDNNFVFRRP
jgi:spermidine synthase